MTSEARTVSTPAPVAEPTPGDWAPIDHWRMTALVRLRKDGPVVAREPVVKSDFDDVSSELEFHALWRHGGPGRTPETLRIECSPRFLAAQADAGLISGFRLRATTPRGDRGDRSFSTYSLQWSAQRAVQRLIDAGRLEAGDPFFYHLEARLVEPAVEPVLEPVLEKEVTRTAALSVPMTVVRRDPPVRWLMVDLPRLLEQASPVGDHDPEWSYVFYTKTVRAQAERLSRLGAKRTPAVESGAALIGTLCMCPRSRDMFVVVTHALRVHDAESTAFSLKYSSRSWQHIQTVIEAMHQQPETATMRLLGQAHGHNFLPANGAPPCEICPDAAVCGRTSVFISQDDLAWTRAVFSGQPYALSHIFGLSARHLRPDPDEVENLFGLGDGRLLRRMYHVIDDFDPSAYERRASDGETACPD